MTLRAILGGARLAWSRLGSLRALWIGCFALCAIALIAAVERRASVAGAADRTVMGLFRVVLPLSAFALAELGAARQRLDASIWPLARFGHHGGAVAIGHAAAVAAGTMLVSTACVLVGLTVARVGASAPGGLSLAGDLFTTTWIGLLASAGYAALFTLGSTFGKRGGGRAALLTLDYVVGGLGPFSLFFPRGSVENLIGLSAPLELSQRASSGVLALVAVALTGLAALRSRR